MKTTSILLSATVLLLTSCVVNNRTNTNRGVEITSKRIFQKPLIVDLDVKEVKVTGTATKTASNQNIQDVKKMALADALKKANADVIVFPVYDIATIKKQIAVSVTGYPASYKNFRPITEEDLKLLEMGRSKIIKPEDEVLYRK